MSRLSHKRESSRWVVILIAQSVIWPGLDIPVHRTWSATSFIRIKSTAVIQLRYHFNDVEDNFDWKIKFWITHVRSFCIVHLTVRLVNSSLPLNWCGSKLENEYHFSVEGITTNLHGFKRGFLCSEPQSWRFLENKVHFFPLSQSLTVYKTSVILTT